MKYFSFLLTFLILSPTFATTFIPIAIEKQVEDANGIIFGVYHGKYVYKKQNDEVVTELSFSIESSVGISSNEIAKASEFKVLIPGGEWQGVVHKVHGVPKFSEQERVMLFLTRSHDGNYWVQNLGLGKYELKMKGNQTILVSSIFPYHPQMGQIPISKFYDIVREIKGQNFLYREGDKTVLHSEITRERAPATAYNINDKDMNARKPSSDEENQKTSVWWLIFVFAMMGGVSTILSRSRVKKH
ncbi:MAG: hypothetical protein JNM93_10425 [Bacteriovoracaceae bacterium]|nr:hypothetical protein [Bacteriovoracaceae bacterium]